MSYRVLVTGSRTWDDRAAIDRVLRLIDLDRRHPRPVTLVSGAARGADQIAEDVARDLGWEVERHPAHWREHGKRAGIIRNRAMVEAGADRCVAFIRNGSPGATHCAETAEKAGILTWRIEAIDL